MGWAGRERSRAHTLSGQWWRPAFAEMENASPARAQSLVSRQTRAQTDPHATRITRTWVPCWAVHKSKRSTLGSAGLNPAQHLRQCKHWLRQDRTSPACEVIGAIQLAMAGPAQHLPGKIRVLLSHEQTDTMRAHKRHLQLFAAHQVGRVPNIFCSRDAGEGLSRTDRSAASKTTAATCAEQAAEPS